MKPIFIILFLAFISSCDQTGLGIVSAVKNVALTPVQAVKSVFSDNEFEKNKEATLSDEKNEDEEKRKVYCLDENNNPLQLSQLDQFLGLAKNIKKTACQCVSWGTCPKEICSCETLCPIGFNIFKHPAEMTCKSLSDEKNGLAFRNSAVPSNHEQTQGYCWGHARVTSQFNRLAFFKPESRAPFDIKSKDESEQNKAIEYYKELIDKVSNNEAIDIPGFPDLNSFSRHPALQSYIGDKVAKSWSDNAMSWQGLATSLGSEKRTKEEYSKVFKDIKERIDLNMQPTIVFTSRGSKFYTHAVLVSHYEEIGNGKIKLCLRDNNNPESNAKTCQDSMTLDETNSLYYSDWGWGEIGAVKVAHNENADANAQEESLRKKCQKEKNCP